MVPHGDMPNGAADRGLAVPVVREGKPFTFSIDKYRHDEARVTLSADFVHGVVPPSAWKSALEKFFQGRDIFAGADPKLGGGVCALHDSCRNGIAFEVALKIDAQVSPDKAVTDEGRCDQNIARRHAGPEVSKTLSIDKTNCA